ncbi:MAG: hypothetical protein V4537_15910 [Pseudomonadota bacterium]
MEAFVGLLALASIVAVVTGAVRYFLPRLRGQRRQSRNIVLAGIGCFILAAVIVPKPTPEQLAERAAADAKAKAADAADARAADAAKAVADKASKAKLQDEAAALWSNIVTEAKPCDNAGDRVASAARSGDVYRLYAVAKESQAACGSAVAATFQLKAPASAVGESKVAFENAIIKCGEAHSIKQIAFGKVADVADGNMRPSAVTEAREKLEVASGGGLYCAAAMMQAASKAGVDSKIFESKT